MRILRSVVAVLTAVLLGMGLLAAAPAQADHGWTIADRLKDTDNPLRSRLKGKVFHEAADGTVDRRYKRDPVKIQRKKCKRCDWKTVKKDRTNRKGRFKATVRYPENPRKTWRWRAKVPARNGWPASTGKVYRLSLD